MNQRIKALAEQATTIEYGADRGFDRVTFDKEKFAELIVRECIDILNKDDPHISKGALLKEHFGIEE